MAKPKLLYLVHRIPYPPNKGDKIRSFHFLQALAAEYQIFLGTFIDDPDDKQHIDALKTFCVDTCCIDLNSQLGKFKSLTGLLTGEALSLPYYRNRELQKWVDKTIAEQNIQRVMIFSSPMAQYVEKYTNLHCVADFVDVDSDKWRQYALSKHWPASWVYRREAEKLLTYEQHIAERADATIFVSEQEAGLFKTLAPESAGKIGFVNNGVDTEKFDPDLSWQTPFPAEQQAIVFTGAMDYWANVDAVKWFAEQVFPVIKSRLPDVHFYIVGSKPAKEVLQLADKEPAVIVTGRVDDVRPYVAYADIVVAPLRIARGIQNKVLEAMAMAKPIVATTAAMEGIPGEEDLQVAIADAVEDFANQVLRFLSQPVESADVNRRYVESDFSWEQNGQRLCRLLAGETA
ncbi:MULTISPECIES: TIGR03087 family PEP-CTERM/XrtA system glycosyltransferase [Methylomonas]|uniref:Sugar transferase n=2 Tax=Methylomonas TaxID=416 RepID=A0A126T1B5_9GAMM|nr:MULTISPECIES: TIGR03087 family PEP-CTERM/XrtA system glycosyltransferase [Methylomonas]AMK75881.1 sugar transferase [Methylomonas denitrificans]OAI01355.1 sugar transferase [Methylomonas methanica]TCV79243.1 sugar transferase (PEP-CTERM/EpsH1 system associated) [Methylomonas methanica]